MGYDDERYWNVPRSPDRFGRVHTPVIAHIDKPKFEPSQQRMRRGKSDESVQIAAVAAATAVWSRSIRSFGISRMDRVNSEWDAALRWISVWDSTALSGDVSINELANSLVENLTTVLEACIEQCHSGEDFGTTFDTYKDENGVVGSSSVRNVLWRSICGWVIGNSLRLSSFGKLDTVVQIVVSSAGAYAIHSLFCSGRLLITDWIRPLRYTETESPDWLIRHEKDLEMAKSSRAMQKKGSSKKTKKRQKLRTPVKTNTTYNTVLTHNSLSSGSSNEGKLRARDSNMLTTVKGDDNVQAPDSERRRVFEDKITFIMQDDARTIAISNDSVGPRIHDEVPSVISLSTATSVTSSPSINAISPSPSPIPENESLERNAGFYSPIALKEMCSQQYRTKNTFAVPTDEQRNKAANQLRDFQNAQIRRLLIQKQQKLSQNSKTNHLPDENLFPTNTSIGNNISGKKNKVLKPPPGFPEFTPVSDDRFQDNLEEELLLSKLLDDDDDNVDDINVSLSVSTESSLDPSAASYFRHGEGGKRHRLEARSKKNDQWSGSKIKGVYGGNVW